MEHERQTECTREYRARLRHTDGDKEYRACGKQTERRRACGVQTEGAREHVGCRQKMTEDIEQVGYRQRVPENIEHVGHIHIMKARV